jgi:hypothetical protein
MSEKYVKTLWANTQINLSRLLISEISGPKDFDSKRQANDYVRRLFVKYNDIMRKLDEIYETLVHPQKRLIIRILLDGIVGRLVELKQEMIKFDSCEYTYFEDLALDQNKTLVKTIFFRGINKEISFIRMIYVLKFHVIFLKIVLNQSNNEIILYKQFLID